jgi:hypothetical protein
MTYRFLAIVGSDRDPNEGSNEARNLSHTIEPVGFNADHFNVLCPLSNAELFANRGCFGKSEVKTRFGL